MTVVKPGRIVSGWEPGWLMKSRGRPVMVGFSCLGDHWTGFLTPGNWKPYY